MTFRIPKPIPVWAVYTALFCIAWTLRFLFLLEFSGHPTFHMPLVDDKVYTDLARAWASGQRPLPVLAWQPWFFPLTLGHWFQIAGPSLWAARLLQITVGSLTCVLTGALGFALWPRRSIRWLAGLTAALYGPLIYLDSSLLAEPWAALWITAAALLALRYRQTPRGNLALGLGVLGALILFTRPPLIAGWPPLLLIAASGWKPIRSTARRIALPHLGILLLGFVLTAWPFVHAIQDATGTARFLPVTGGINFYVGNSATPCETLNIRPGTAWENLTLLPELHGAHTDDEKDVFFRNKALQDIRSHPRVFAGNLLAKTRQFVSSREIPRNLDIYTDCEDSLLMRPLVWKAGGFGFPFGLLIGLAAIGLWVRRPVSWGLALAIAGYAAAIIAVHVCDRYRLPVVPLFIVLGACGMRTIYETVRQRHWKQTTLLAGVILALGIGTSLGAPFCAERLNYRAELYRLISTTAYEQHNRPLAETYALMALKEDPCEAQAWNQLGLLKATRGQLEEAEADFQRALECDPSIAQAWFNRGKVAARQKQIETAKTYFYEGLKHFPTYLPAWIELGDLCLKQGQIEEAKACYEETLRIRPGFPAGSQRMTQIKRLRLDR